jgi:hypothetical protein
VSNCGAKLPHLGAIRHHSGAVRHLGVFSDKASASCNFAFIKERFEPML